jgi:DNA (cytosine-5)-methyltransferase 1
MTGGFYMEMEKVFNFIDLFAGAGGLSEGFQSIGFKPVAHVEMNPEACLTLKTRACYYYLKNKNKLEVYRKYLSGKINRDELFSSVPENILSSVINRTMSKETMPELFKEIDTLLSNQKEKKIDLIVGGSPCQAYSLVGRAVSSNGMKKDPRNYLYRLYCMVLERYKPEMFIFENVPGLLNASGGKYLKDMKKEFRRVGYFIDYKVLNSCDFGVLQNRKRIIIFGWKSSKKRKYPEFESSMHSYTIRDILDDLPVLQAGETRNRYRKKTVFSSYLLHSGIRTEDDILTWNVSRPNIKRDRDIYRAVVKAWNKDKIRLKYPDLPEELKTHKNTTAFVDRFKVVASNLPVSHTIMAHISKDGHYFIHPDIKQARSITVREAARIQSFPDNFYFEGSRTSVFTQIGNAVPPLMARGIALKILEELKGGN